jgi:hypothetical protein
VIEHYVEPQPETSKLARLTLRSRSALPPFLNIVGAAGYLLCIVFSVTPLVRLPDRVIRLSIPLGSILARAGAWLPGDLDLGGNPQDSQTGSAMVLFLCLMALAFAFYAMYAWGVARQPAQNGYHRRLRSLIWIVTALAGLIYVFTPAMLSHDILVYASYSRLLTIYHANPYFIPLSAFPHDPYVPLDYYASSVAAYGPLWLAVCGIMGLIAGPQPFSYVLAYRLLALAAHLLNTWLVGRTLREMNQSQRTITLGMALYALNPLVLLESSLGGHNDVFMMTLLLAGILLAARAERREGLLSPGGYLPPLIMFTFAALVKFTTLPVIALYLVLLAWKARHQARVPATPVRFASPVGWKQAIRVTLFSTGAVILVALAFYGPFWIGHSLTDIHNSFTSPPSAQFSENSMLRAIGTWSRMSLTADQRASNVVIGLLSQRSIWDAINYVSLGIACILSALALWRSPTLHTWLLASLAALGVLLIVTPWFYSWYITWIVSLAAVSVELRHTRAGRALLACTLTFSASALLTYLFVAEIPPFGMWIGLDFLWTIAPPVAALLVTIATFHPAKTQRPGEGSEGG